MKDARPSLTALQIRTRLKHAGKWIRDDFNDSESSTFRWTPRVDARAALLGSDAEDYDLDGCTNGKEFGNNPVAGGMRNPLDFWDFYDVWTPDPQNPGQYHRDGAITTDDITQVANRFFTIGTETSVADALTPPTSPTGYHASYDRGGVAGPNPWNQAPADGAIVVDDITAVAAQFLHSC